MDARYDGYILRLSRIEGQSFCLEVVGLDTMQVGHLHRLLVSAEEKQAVGAGFMIVQNLSEHRPQSAYTGIPAKGTLAKVESNYFKWVGPDNLPMETSNLERILGCIECSGNGIILEGFSREVRTRKRTAVQSETVASA